MARRIGVVLIACFLLALAQILFVDGHPVSDLSPDGVELHDLTRPSFVWGRSFDLALPPGITQQDVLDACQATQTPYMGFRVCLGPYMIDLHWIDADGDPVGTHASVGVIGDGGDECTERELTIGFGEFKMYDEIDPGSKVAEPYVDRLYERCSGTVNPPAYWCPTGETGNCQIKVSHKVVAFLIFSTWWYATPYEIEFWDSDQDVGGVDDILDISPTLCDAISSMRINDEAVYGIYWTAEERAPEPTYGTLCRHVREDVLCELEGQADTGDTKDSPGADNDDAGLKVLFGHSL